MRLPTRPKAELLLPENYLKVGLTEDETEVLVNHPNLLVDAQGCGHIVFSPLQARHLARLLLIKADDAERAIARREGKRGADNRRRRSSSWGSS